MIQNLVKTPDKHSIFSPRVVVTSLPFGNSKVLRSELKQNFPDCHFNESGQNLSKSDLIGFLKNADAAIVGRETVDDALLSQAPRLKIVAKFGVGLDNIDEESLRRRNIALGWTGGTNRRSVAELTLCFMLGLCRNVFSAGFKLKHREWNKDGGDQLTGKTVGVIGCGNIGSEVIRLLSPFQCELLINDIIDKSSFCNEHHATETNLDDLLTKSDIVSLHIPLTPLTNKMVDINFLQKMKPAAFLINTCRGEVVVHDALKEALKQGDIAGAALDVFSEEPPTDEELLSLPNLMVTPHIAGHAKEAVEAMGRSAIAHLVSYFKSE